MKNYLKILFNTRYVFFINFIEKIVFFVFFLILARELDKSSYGLVTTVFAFTGILHSFFDLGFNFYFQREAENDGISQQISNAFTFRVLSSLLFFSILLGYLFLYLHIDLKIVAIVGGLTYLHGFNTLLTAFLYGKKEYRNSFHSFLISRLIFALLLILMLFINLRGYYILLSLFISVLIHLFILLKITAAKGLQIEWQLNKKVLGRIIKSSLPIGIGSIFVLLYDKVDVLLIERYLSLESVAVYAIAYSVYKLFHIISSIILTSVYTDFSRAYSSQKHINWTEIRSTFILLLILSMVFIIFIILFGDKLVLTIFGNKYLDSIQYLKYLILALPALYLNNLTGVICNSIRKEKIPMYITGIGAFVNVLSNFILISLISIWGAVAATIITEYTVFILQALILLKENKKLKFVL